MGIVELILVAVALSMDAFAVGLTNGMTDSKMKVGKVLLIAAFYGAFQMAMPLIGYYVSGIFSSLIEKVAPWVSFILLAFIGGKMLYDGVKEWRENKRAAKEQEGTHALDEGEEGDTHAQGGEGGAAVENTQKPLRLSTLALQALATSIDALAVGVTLLAAQTAGTLCLNVWWDSLIIGCITFVLSIGAVYLGKAIGNKLADKAEMAGGAVLIIIGVKILVEGLI